MTSAINRRLDRGRLLIRTRSWARYFLVAVLGSAGLPALVAAQPVRCDPAQIVSADACAKCHGNEVRRWQQTPHAMTFDQLVRNPKAKEMTERLGLASVKRNEICIQCHFTTQEVEPGKAKPIAGVSCESCHGAAQSWLTVHNDYGGPTALKADESAEHRITRLLKSSELGMRNTQNVYLIARSCYQCHTIPHERLVNEGGHPPSSAEFELVAWSQGSIRHNFLRTGGSSNAESTPARLRLLFVCGLLADLEFSTRATAVATEKRTYGLGAAERAARAANRLFQLQQQLHDPLLEQALEAFAAAELRTHNAAQLEAIADRISNVGIEFANVRDGASLAAVDAWLPDPATYR